MKRYSELMAAYKLPPARRAELRALCRSRHSPEVSAAIRQALAKATPDGLGAYVYAYVTRRNMTVSALKAAGMPCHERTFIVRKARFFYELDKLVPQPGEGVTACHRERQD